MIGNKMSVNSDKTKYLKINTKSISIPVNIILNLNTISPSEYAIYFDVSFQSDISLEKTSSFCRKNLFPSTL